MQGGYGGGQAAAPGPGAANQQYRQAQPQVAGYGGVAGSTSYGQQQSPAVPVAAQSYKPAAAAGQYGPAAASLQYQAGNGSQYQPAAAPQYPASSTAQYPGTSSAYQASAEPQRQAAVAAQYPGATAQYSASQYPSQAASQYQAGAVCSLSLLSYACACPPCLHSHTMNICNTIGPPPPPPPPLGRQS
jgi:hypothetical protein